MAIAINENTPVSKIDSKESYLNIPEGNSVIYLVQPVFGGIIKFDQTWLIDKEGKQFPVQNFASEIGAEKDPVTAFVQNPVNKEFVKNPNGKPQTNYRMLVAVEEKGKFTVKVANLHKSLVDALTNFVRTNELGITLLDNADAIGTKIQITKSKTGKKFGAYDVYQYAANIVPQKNKPDFTDLLPEIEELNIENGIGGKTPAEVVARINERGLPFDFVVA